MTNNIENNLEDTYKQIFEAIKDKDSNKVKQIILDNPNLDINYKTTIYSKSKTVQTSSERSLFREVLRNFNEDEELIMFFLERGADLTEGIFVGNTLHIAASKGHYKLFNYLIGSSIDFNEKNNYGKTAIELAVNNKLSNDIFLALYNNEEIIKTPVVERHYNHLHLLKHPLTNYCTAEIKNNDVINNILTNSYSTTVSKEVVKQELNKILYKSNLLSEILYTKSIDLNKGPFAIILVNNMNQYDPSRNNDSINGYYDQIDFINRKLVVVGNTEYNLNIGTLIHELTHGMMHSIFKSSISNIMIDNTCLPYYTKNEKESFHNALKETLLNVNKYYMDEYGINLEVDENKTTYNIGRELFNKTNILSNLLSSNNEEIKRIFEQSPNIDINNYISVFGKNILNEAYLIKNIDLVKIFIEAGAKIENTELIEYAIIGDNIDFITWLTQNIHNIDIYKKKEKGFSILEFAKLKNNTEIIEFLENYALKNPIADWLNYFSSFITSYNNEITSELTYNNHQTNLIEDNIITQKAIDILLNTYNDHYKEISEDTEFVVRLPQIIAMGYDNEQVKSIMKPMYDYWEEFISPAATQFMETYDKTNYCGLPADLYLL